MRLASMGFLLGVCAVLFLTTLPTVGSVVLLCLLSLVLVCFFRAFAPIFFVSMGLLWVLLTVLYYDHSNIIDKYNFQTVKVLGVVSSIPKESAKLEKFMFTLDRLDNQALDTKIKVKLAWYDDYKKVHVGQRWRFVIKLKKPRGFLNPGSVDVVKLALWQHIDATAYIVKADQALLLKQTMQYRLLQWREKLNNTMKFALTRLQHGDIIRALVLGVRDDISTQDWRLFRMTGTSHLMSISGLHVGLVAGAVYFIFSFIFKLSSSLCRYIPATRLATFMALGFAIAYSLLTGFGIPEQRALIMLLVFMLSRSWGLNVAPWTAFCLALWIVLIIEPLSVVMPGFWLSFLAVAVMISLSIPASKKWFIKWFYLQWAIMIGLFPFCLLFFAQVSFISPLVNFIAVPLIGFIVVPLSLLAAMMMLLSGACALGLFYMADQALTFLWLILNFCASLPYASVFISANNVCVLLVLVSSSVAVIFSSRPYLKVLAYVGFSVLFAPIYSVDHGLVDVTVLDVGQGLSTVVRTEHHVLVFDTGPYFGGDFNAGDAVLIPFLRYYNVRQVDVLILSHGHIDHTGGASSLLHEMPVDKVMTSIPHYQGNSRIEMCYAGQGWVWDGVIFDVIYPPRGLKYTANNSSCVLHITAKDRSFLLTGDIEKEAELNIIKKRLNVRSDILIAPHHGSHTSSTAAFLDAVAPEMVVFSTGFHNHYHFPHPSIVARYEKMNVKAYNTANTGAININRGVSLYRNTHKHWWL